MEKIAKHQCQHSVSHGGDTAAIILDSTIVLGLIAIIESLQIPIANKMAKITN
jgi:hypothetical protein